jgi:hypothetical protein
MATECLRFAQDANDPKNRAVLVEMAQAWIRLAEQARQSENDQSTRMSDDE